MQKKKGRVQNARRQFKKWTDHLSYDQFIPLVINAVRTLRIDDENYFTQERIAGQIAWTRFGGPEKQTFEEHAWIRKDWIHQAMTQDVTNVSVTEQEGEVCYFITGPVERKESGEMNSVVLEQEQSNQQSMEEGSVPLSTARSISLTRIVIDPDPLRAAIDETELKELAQSIKKHGLLQPIRVRWCPERQMWVVVAGERRYRAHQLNGAQQIDAICVSDPMEYAQLRIEQLVENLHRCNLKPCEKARAFRALMEREQWTPAKLSRELHLSRSSVSEVLSLLKLNPELQAKVDSGHILIREAYRLAREQNGKYSRKNKKRRKRGARRIYYLENGDRIVIAFPRKVGVEEIRQVLWEILSQEENQINIALNK